jgi:hypothetical protein
MNTPRLPIENPVARKGYSDPAYDGFAITPADADLTIPARALYVGTGGDLAVVMFDGSALIFKNVSSGSILSIAVKRVAAATTAADIIGLV